MATRYRGSKRGSQDPAMDLVQPAVRSFNINIQNFDGDPAMLEFFFSQLEDLVKFNGYSDEQSITMLKSKLKGNALEFYLSSNELKLARSISEAKDIMSKFFSTSAVRVSAVELNSIRLLPGESVRSLVHRIGTVACKVYPSMQKNALEQIKLVQLIAALPPDIQCKMYESNITDYQEAVKLAQNIQDAQIASCVMANRGVNFSDQVNELKDQVNALRRSSVRCQLCESFEHTAKQCYMFRNPDLGERNTGNARDNGARVTCQFCGRPGHILRDCFRFQGSRNYRDSFRGRNNGFVTENRGGYGNGGGAYRNARANRPYQKNIGGESNANDYVLGGFSRNGGSRNGEMSEN